MLDSASASADLYLVTDEAGSLIEVLGKDGQTRSIASGAEGSASVVTSTVRTLKQTWAAKALAALDNPFRPFGIDITTTREDAAGKRAGVTVTITPERTGFLTLVTLAPDGSLAILTSDALLDGRLDADEPVRIKLERPTSAAGSETGLRFVLAIVTPVPLEGLVLPTAATEPRDQLIALRQALEEATSAPGSALKWNSRLIVLRPAAR